MTTLTGSARAVLEAVLECLHPADELGPGATEVGLPGYLLGQLEGPLRRFVPWYVTGLSALDRHARTTTGKPFADLAPSGQEAVLSEFEALGAEPEFFDLLIEHAYEGLFGDPAYGGNAQGAGWRLVGYPGPQPVVSAQEQQFGHVRPSSGTSIYALTLFAAGRPA
ncbi:gluconate 2-dehydrogenase subunit 3 family protein [Amycolatopsis jejuensis]|uniref:gluconate 2-dehydrogenase subunit 3 family protein n=1 Tax=Amycolatopsis jejuensis TaxID=330084 RepID=UPI0005258AA8|nr:gluconate 2-dehydrogenase subunit 3 family protein [Amycolatopsis jejuensis]